MNDFCEQPKILVVDDSAAIRCYVTSLLATAGYRVREAVDGAGALAALQAEQPDVVLLDVEMPGLSGLDVLRTPALHNRIYSVILFTTQSAQDQIALGLDLGADDYVIKPFHEVDLLARIRAAVRSTRQKGALARARQEMEQTLAKLQKTQRKLVEQEKVGAVARLAAGAAHYINNPLGFVMSNLSTLERYALALQTHAADLTELLRTADPDSEERIAELEKKHRLRQITLDLPALLQETREGGGRIALIVQQMAQLELGLANQGVQELELVGLMKPLVDMITVLAPPGTEVRWSQPEGPIFVEGSLTLLNTALVALLKNACEALGSVPGTISVSIGSQQELAEITISDSGPGIPQDQISSLFDPFFTTKSPDSHVGLGLTIAQRFIAGHGGRILVSSDTSGTCVRVEIPLAPSQAPLSRLV
ncbi:response regulator [Geomonas sp. Red69]|uniref:sensor histidine kinase n=1 Tax=Geomonas diazotrophica TaxID=2843197 RepID=UPI001C10C540|nr:response regulator [Geomonas diazotrophica]MBU5635243.1 response regulator [Geomonas diazotrophica]